MDLSIIIINYKSAHHVLNCLESVYVQTQHHSFECIVVDNASGDDSESQVLQRFPVIKWIQAGYNAGFARANNIGIRAAAGRNVLLLNADTIVLDGALDKALHLFESSDAVACGVQLLNTDGSHQISGAHTVKGGLNMLLPLPYLGRWVRYWGYRLKTQVPSVQNIAGKVYVDWIVGAFILAKRTTIDAAGLLDEDFFMYAEEIEWCARLRKQGKLCLFSEPKVVHLGGGTSSDYYGTTEGENSKNLWNRKARQIIVSQMLRIRKQFGVSWFLVMLFFYFLTIPLFVAGLLAEKLFKGKRARYSWEHVQGYISNMAVLARYIPRILRNRAYFYKVY